MLCPCCRQDTLTEIFELIKFNDIVINDQTKRVFRHDIEVKLTKTEFDILKYFMVNCDRMVSREEILSYLGLSVASRYVDVYNGYINKHMGARVIEAIRSFGGYRLVNSGVNPRPTAQVVLVNREQPIKRRIVKMPYPKGEPVDEEGTHECDKVTCSNSDKQIDKKKMIKYGSLYFCKQECLDWYLH